MLRNPLPCPAATARSLLLPSLLVGLGALVAVPVAAQNWFVGRTPVTFGAPPGTVVLDLTLSADELVAFFVADRPGGAGGLDLWWATRTRPGGAWSTARPFNGNTAADETGPTLGPDGLELFFVSDRGGTPRVLRSIRRVGTTTWSPPQPVAELNGPGATTDPALTEDGLTIFFGSTRRGSSDVYAARRPSRGAPFGSVLPLPGLNDPTAFDGDPAPESGGAILWFSSDRRGGAGGRDYWVSWRDANTGSWATPVPVTELNTTGDDDGMFVSALGITTYLNSALGPIVVDCICRNGPVGTSLGAANGTVSAESSAAWPVPLLFVTGADWSLGASQSLSFYDWKVAGGPVSYLPAISASRLGAPLVPPVLSFGAVEIDPSSLIPLPPAAPDAFGYARVDVAIPDVPALRGRVIWTQAFGVTRRGSIDMTVPQRITLR